MELASEMIKRISLLITFCICGIAQAEPVLLMCESLTYKNPPTVYYELDIDAGTLKPIDDGVEDNPHYIEVEFRIEKINEYKIVFRVFFDDKPWNVDGRGSYAELDRRTLVMNLALSTEPTDGPMAKGSIQTQCKINPKKKV